MNDTPVYTPGQQVYVATFRSKPYRDEKSTITLDVIETDGGGHVVLVNGGVYVKEQVSTDPLEVINWLRERIEQEVGHLAVLSHKLTVNAGEIGEQWKVAYEANGKYLRLNPPHFMGRPV